VCILGLAALALGGATAVRAGALEARVVDDALSLRAEGVPLQDVLAQLQEAGIRIRIDPRVNPRVTAHFENRDLRASIEALLSDCDYALFLSLIEGPAGPMRRVSEIDVYMRGDRRQLKPLPGTGDNLARAQAPVRSNMIVCVRNEVLVRFKRGVPAETVKNLLARIGGTMIDGIPALGIYRIRLVPGADLAAVLNTLGETPGVERASPNLVYRPVEPARSGGKKASGSRATSDPAGNAAAVAVLDTGLLPSAGIEARVLAALDATAPDRPLTDALGHGTQMALIASGATCPEGVDQGGATVSGVPIIPIRAFDDNGYASEFALMQSMVFALDNGARVINMSWGSDSGSGFIDEAVAYADQQGAILVAAAGNEPTGRPIYPAACSNVVAVAALDAEGKMWPRSNYGAFVTLAAPGEAAFPVGYKGPAGQYAGTSVATAFTANALARYLALHPDATAREAVAALNRSLTRVEASEGVKHPEIGRFDNRALATLLKP
jgi:hypothetical protein